MAMREEVYEILPFILTLSNETFEYQKLTKLSALPGRGATDFSDLIETSSATILCKPGENVSLWIFLGSDIVPGNHVVRQSTVNPLSIVQDLTLPLIQDEKSQITCTFRSPQTR